MARWANIFAEVPVEGLCWASFFAEELLEGRCWASFIALTDPALVLDAAPRTSGWMRWGVCTT